MNPRIAWLTPLLLIVPATESATAQGTLAHYCFENGVPGEAAEGTDSILDCGPNGLDGTPTGGPVYSGDVALLCQPNDVSLALDGVDDSITFDYPFVFHVQYPVEATLEFLIKAPDPILHRPLFWTNTSSVDENRFHLNLNGGGMVGFDYRAPNGVLHDLLHFNNSELSIDLDVWTHIAVTRIGNDDGSHTYSFFKNGTFVVSKDDASPSLPNADQWTIDGPPTGFIPATGIIDEVRLSDRALQPDEFLYAGSPISNYCTANANSTGQSALIGSIGIPSVSTNFFFVRAGHMPAGQCGLFYYGPEEAQVPFGDGTRCVGSGSAGFFRLNPVMTIDDNGNAIRLLDFTQPPANCGSGQITPGSTWYFQFWYRDPAANGAGFNLTDGLEVTFCE